MRLVTLLCLAISVGVAQSPEHRDADAPVRVCVGTPANVSHLAISSVVERDRLIDQINVRDGGKGKKKVVALPLPGADTADTLSTARERDCRFLVSLRLEESFGYVPRNIDPVSHQPPITQGGLQATRRATLAYSIARVDSTGNLDEGGIPLRAGGDDDAAVSEALSRLSPRIVHDAVKSKP
jgi:hypothetical protein